MSHNGGIDSKINAGFIETDYQRVSGMSVDLLSVLWNVKLVHVFY